MNYSAYEHKKNRIINKYEGKQITYKIISNFRLPYIDEETCNDFYKELKNYKIKVVDDGTVCFNDMMNDKYLQNLKNDFFDYIDELNEYIILKTGRRIEVDDCFDLQYIYDEFYLNKILKDTIVEKVIYLNDNNGKEYRKYKNQVIEESLNKLYENMLRKWSNKDLTEDFEEGVSVESNDLVWKETIEESFKFEDTIINLNNDLSNCINFEVSKYEVSYYILNNLSSIFYLSLNYPNLLTNIVMFELNYVILNDKKICSVFTKINSFQKYLFNVASICYREIKSFPKMMLFEYHEMAIKFAYNYDIIYDLYLSDNKSYETAAGLLLTI